MSGKKGSEKKEGGRERQGEEGRKERERRTEKEREKYLREQITGGLLQKQSSIGQSSGKLRQCGS